MLILLVLKRLAFILCVAAGIVFFCFFGLSMAANSRAATPSYDPCPHARLAARATVTFARGLWRGDLGTMEAGAGRSVRRVDVEGRVAELYPRSAALLGCALLVAAALGVPLGILAARRAGSPLSLGTLTAALLGVSLPSFFVAALLQISEITWFRAFGYRLVPVGGFGYDAHLILPTLVLAARPLAHLTRVAHAAFADVAAEDYVRTARAKGLPRRLIVWVHMARNAAVPLLTGLGVSLRYSLASLPVVEAFFGWPGLGQGLLEAIRLRQAQGVAAMALSLGLTLLLVNLLLDLLYRVADPRLRGRGV